MAEQQEPPPRRTLGDYVMYQGPRHFSSIAIPTTAKALEINPDFLTLISAYQFTAMEHEDPYSHLDTFYALIGTMGFQSGDLENVYMRLFSFSLAGKAKEWLKSLPNQSLTSWKDVEEKFLQRFFPISRYIKAKSEISMFRQGANEVFCDTWERFKMILRKCPNHGFEDIAQLSIFLNGLRSDIKMLLDAAAGGTMMALDVEQATIIIDALTSTDYKAQHDGQDLHNKGLLEDALLAKNKILTQQIEQLTAQMAKLPQQLYVVHSSQSQSQSIRCDFCGDVHPNGHCFYQNNLPEVEDPSMLERMNKVEDALTKIVSAQDNSMAMIRSIKIQMGQLTKQIAQIPEEQNGQFSVNSQTNSKEHCDNVVAEKEEKDETKGKRDEKERSEEEKIKRKSENKERGVLEKDLSYPHSPSKKEKERKFFDKLLPKNYFAGNLKQDSTFERFRKNRSYIEERNIELEDGYNVIIPKGLPQKFKDPGSFNLPVSIGALLVANALLDLGASVNIIPLAMLKKIGDLEIKPTKMTLKLADQVTKYPYGVVEDVLVKVDKFTFPVDFVVMDMKEDEEVPLILGRPFMKTARIIVDVDKGELQVRTQDEEGKNVYRMMQQRELSILK
ncbi:uncharacterized protein [Phaseolus vulgaris]|uniref:uncharacterized protein n=1 Tax=Phaseolus vulgaris TaxID=3885 RepID=UPI0035CBE962